MGKRLCLNFTLCLFITGARHPYSAGRHLHQLETLNYVATITSAWSGATRQVELVRADQPSVVRNPFRQAAVLAYTSPSTANPM